MPSIEDIDEDEPAPIVIGTNKNTNNNSSNNNNNNNKDMMDDLFGPGTPSTASSNQQMNNSNTTTTNSQQQQEQQQSKPPKDALDDFFGGGGNNTSSSNNRNNNNNNSNTNKKNDVFDALFTGGGGSTNTGPNTVGSSNNNYQNNNVHSNNYSSSSSSTTTHQQRSAIDHLDAFSAISKGSAVPWKQQNTQSVSESHVKVLDIFGDGNGGSADGGDNGQQGVHNDRGVFIPPDQVLSLMTLYDVLGAAPSWPVEDISKAYKAKALKLHPDKLPGGKRTDREDRYFKVITAAYDILKDKEKRAEYDNALRSGSAGGSSSWLNFVS